MRQEGFYWVRLHNEWTIGEWNGECWFILSYKNAYMESELDEIGEVIIR